MKQILYSIGILLVTFGYYNVNALKCYVCLENFGTIWSDLAICPIPFQSTGPNVLQLECDGYTQCTTAAISFNKKTVNYRFCTNGEYMDGVQNTRELTIRLPHGVETLRFDSDINIKNCDYDLCNDIDITSSAKKIKYSKIILLISSLFIRFLF